MRNIRKRITPFASLLTVSLAVLLFAITVQARSVDPIDTQEAREVALQAYIYFPSCDYGHYSASADQYCGRQDGGARPNEYIL